MSQQKPKQPDHTETRVKNANLQTWVDKKTEDQPKKSKKKS